MTITGNGSPLRAEDYSYNGLDTTFSQSSAQARAYVYNSAYIHKIEFEKIINYTKIGNFSPSENKKLHITGEIPNEHNGLNFKRIVRILPDNIEELEISGVKTVSHVQSLNNCGLRAKRLSLPGITKDSAVKVLQDVAIAELWLNGIATPEAVQNLKYLNKKTVSVSLGGLRTDYALAALKGISPNVKKITLNGIKTYQAVLGLEHLHSNISTVVLNGINTKEAMEGLESLRSMAAGVDTLVINGIRTADAQVGFQYIPRNIHRVVINRDAVQGLHYMPETISVVRISGIDAAELLGKKQGADSIGEIQQLPNNIKAIYCNGTDTEDAAIKLAKMVRENIAARAAEKLKLNTTLKATTHLMPGFFFNPNPLIDSESTLTKRIELARENARLQKQVTQLNKQVTELGQQNAEKDRVIDWQAKQLQGKDAKIQEQARQLHEKDNIINGQKKIIEEQANENKRIKLSSKEKDETIAGLRKELSTLQMAARTHTQSESASVSRQTPREQIVREEKPAKLLDKIKKKEGCCIMM